MTVAVQIACPAPVTQQLMVNSSGVQLATYRWGNPARPTLLLVHGYPDNHEVWLPLINQLAADFQIIAYDVRGAGASDKPRHPRDYRLPLLADDLEAVILAHSPTQPVHLIAHDWGSIQSWEGVTEPRLQKHLASYTSISGPCLDHVGYWMGERGKARTFGALRQLVGQLRSSWYIAFFHLPLLPELAWRHGMAKLWPRFLRQVEGIRPVRISSTQSADGQHGVKLYRANFIRSLFTPRQRYTQVPVQLVVLTRDRFVRPQLFDNLQHWAPNLVRREVAAGHWQLLAEPAPLAGWIKEFVAAKGQQLRS
jgi:pimeloyl-ACP methyl ester carboxylesterase